MAEDEAGGDGLKEGVHAGHAALQRRTAAADGSHCPPTDAAASNPQGLQHRHPSLAALAGAQHAPVPTADNEVASHACDSVTGAR